MRDAVVIGAGLAGLAATLRLARGGAKVTLVTKGLGGLQLSQGTIDVLGYSEARVEDPLGAISEHVSTRPTHPYTHFTPEFVGEAAAWLKEVLGPELLLGDPHANVLLPTALGALRPTCLYQPSMAAGIARAGRSYAIVGLRRLKDFYPTLIAENLSRQPGPDGEPIMARSIIVDVEIRKDEVDTTGTNHARALDDPAMRAQLVAAIKPHLNEGEIVGLPAVLGLNDPGAWRDIADRLGHEVFEIPMQPPSIPGMRLNQALTALVKKEARFILGSAVTGVEAEDGAVRAVTISTAGRPTRIETKNVVLAGGGFESGALDMDSYGTLSETILGLPVLAAEGQLLHGDFWGSDQPVFLAGLEVDDDMHPLGAGKSPVYSNVYAAGGNLAGATRWREKSGEGIALASALRAADQILGSLK
ncbi:MAG: glycerol-3-phosphate dehydrogenase subunit GlpB [Schaalia hyovaginalis]|uniref:glycerol-3-phosphate dehydrogenase subunit GlpB n=1 Tax=Schaalia hyovaginalis TaxID=29316 RepID=UPI0026EFF863|nr:glycerol-3-phosphate dehydrogenase subunit GlpB [Schaalia hyovaginalis]MCI7513607.1 glycerol-3-phosphate dehydrogenase subunit GlpB [Schaalia hyovaginalis]MDY4262591.1 glycerol-3-phosphate dehydrogenase subunit GlpB [Schaalia hyovaginalis]MDY5600692.1 glycerol-3-phosphate dehydrogenase subunit GlpB [Schaalia hyovaginalis]